MRDAEAEQGESKSEVIKDAALCEIPHRSREARATSFRQ
jgi:hypothetical protein